MAIQNFLSDIKLGDNIYIRLGDGSDGDLRLYHNETHSYIDSANTGDFYIRSLNDDVVIQGADDVFIYTQGGEDAIIARGDGAVELYHDSSKKFETDTNGVEVIGGLGVGRYPSPIYGIYQEFNSTDANTDNKFAYFIDGNFSGADNTDGDREQGGIKIDIDSTADGDNSDEHRLYGVWSDIRYSGLSDVVRGIYTFVENNNSTGSEVTAETTALYASSVSDGTSATAGTNNLRGVYGQAVPQNSGYVANSFGGFFISSLSTNRAADLTSVAGVRGEVSVDSTNSITLTNARAVQGIIDINSTTPTITNSYLFYAGYEGTTSSITNKYGLYTLGADNINRISGKTAIGEITNPAQKLHVSAGHLRLDDTYKIEWGGSNARIDGSNASDYLRFFTSDTERLNIASDGTIKFNAYGAGYLKTDANGVISVDTSTIEDTLQTVTDRGSTTTNTMEGTRLGLGAAPHASAALQITTTAQHMRLNNGTELGIIHLLSGGELELWAHGDGETINFRTGSGTGELAAHIDGTDTTFQGDVTVNQDLIVGNAAGSATTAAFGSFDQLRFDNSYNDTNRGPNKIVMHNNGGAWAGGFGVHTDTVAYYSGAFHTFYKTTSQTASTELLKIASTGIHLASSSKVIKADLSSGGTTRTAEIEFYNSSNGAIKYMTTNSSTGGHEFWTQGSKKFEIEKGGNATFAGSISSGDITSTHTGGGTINLRRDDTTISGTNTLGAILFQGDDPTDGTFNSGAAIFGTANGSWSSGSYPGQLELKTRNTSGSLVTALTLDSSQNATFEGDVTVEGGHQKILVGAYSDYAAASDRLYIGGDGLASTDAAIYIGNRGNGTGYGYRIYYEGSGSGNNNKLILKSENVGTNVDMLSFTADGNATFASTINAPDGSATTPAYNFTSHDGNGMYLEDYDASNNKEQVSIATDGNRRMRVNEAGVFAEGNFYAGGDFRSFASPWHATAGTSGAGFRFENTHADTNNVVALDLSATGNATFAGDVTLGGTSSETRTLTLQTNSEKDSVINLKEGGATYGFSIGYYGVANDFIIKRHDNSTNGTDVFTLYRENNHASFAGNITTTGNLMPSADSTYNVGSSSVRWDNVYADNLYGIVDKLSVTANDTFTGTYSLLWHSGNVVYSSSFMTINGSTDTLSVPNISTGNATFTGNITLDDDTTESPYVGYIDNSGANSSDIEYRTYSTNGNFLITRTGNGGADIMLSGHATDHTSSTTTFAGDVTVGGDLIVSGDTVTLSTQTVEVEDNIIVLNKTQSDGSATASTSGIAINRGGSTAQASFIFDDGDDYWDLTHNLAVAGNGKFANSTVNIGPSNIGLDSDGDLTAGGNLRFATGSGGNVDIEAGGTFAIKDYDDSTNLRFSVDTSNGDTTVGGNLYADNVAITSGDTIASLSIYADTHNTNVANISQIQMSYQHSGGVGEGFIKLTEDANNSFGADMTFGVPHNNGSGGSTTRTALTLDGGTLAATFAGAVSINAVNDAYNFKAFGQDADSWFGVYDDANNSANIILTRSDTAEMFKVMGHTGNTTIAGDLDVGNLRIVGDNDSADQGKAFIRSNGDYLVLNAADGEHVYLNWDSANGGSGNVYVSNYIYAKRLYDSNDTTYYVDPAGGSNLAGGITVDGNSTFDDRLRVNGWIRGASDTNVLFSNTTYGTLLQAPGNTANNNNSKIFFRDSAGNNKHTFDTNNGNATIPGNVTHNGLTMTNGTDVDQVKEFSMTFQLSANTWTDTDIDGTDLATGTYIMQVMVDDYGVGGGHYTEYYSATISWFSTNTNDTGVDEIIVHRAGHASTSGDVQFRTQRTVNADSHDLMLQVKHNKTYSAALDGTTAGKKMIFKFRRLI